MTYPFHEKNSGEIEDIESYNMARRRLVLAERSQAFDARFINKSSKIEFQAARLVKKIISYDDENTYGKNSTKFVRGNGKRTRGEHFLGNCDLINQTKLIKVARKMPKGAHLHIHFNSCLPAKFLLRQARDVAAMYIRSSLPLTSKYNMKAARISFQVMSLHEATHILDAQGVEEYVPLANLWNEDYVPFRWMPYRSFHSQFDPCNRVSRGEKRFGLESTLLAESWLEKKLNFSEHEVHNSKQTGHGIWEKFNCRTQMMKGLFCYESAFRLYTAACIRDFVQDNIQYAEVRPNFMSTNSIKKDDGSGTIGNVGMVEIIKNQISKTTEELRKEGKYFGGMKVIYCAPRSFHREQIRFALNECIELKRKFPDLMCGFDLVGHEEMGNELRLFVPEFLNFRKKCKKLGLDIPFLFHCGETLDNGGKVDGNLYDAILLNSKRIGHGYSVARHPFLMEQMRHKGIAIESCPISNEILGLTPIIAGHHLPILLANNIPCTINSDNASFYKSSLSHDFYQVMIGSNSMSLQGWKQLAQWSLDHSCMDARHLEEVKLEWTRRWEAFCQWIVDEFGPQLECWEPNKSRQ